MCVFQRFGARAALSIWGPSVKRSCAASGLAVHLRAHESDVSGVRGGPQDCDQFFWTFFGAVGSIDWFKGKITGKSLGFHGKIWLVSG